MPICLRDFPIVDADRNVGRRENLADYGTPPDVAPLNRPTAAVGDWLFDRTALEGIQQDYAALDLQRDLWTPWA